MLARVALFWSRLRNSLWALPLALCLAGAALAITSVRIRINPGGDPIWWLYSGDAAYASTFISNLLSAMITMATLAISITMVVLTLAAQSLGPRLIPIFMSDNRTKLSLGLLLGTVVYLLLVLRSFAGDTSSVPNLAVTIAVALVLISVFVLLFFVHHLATSIVADTVIARVGRDLDRQIAALSTVDNGNHTGLSERKEKSFRKNAAPFRSKATGYLQAIDFETLSGAAKHEEAVVLLTTKPGHLVLAGEVVGWIKPKKAASDDLLRALKSCLILGSDRTPSQDLEYTIRQLVEIALRALSPGINDPHTAAAVIDRLATSIQRLLATNGETGVWCGADGKPRLYHPSTNFSALLSSAFTEIRQAGAHIPAVLSKLTQRYLQLLEIAPDDRKQSIRLELKRLETTIRNAIANPVDRKLLLDALKR